MSAVLNDEWHDSALVTETAYDAGVLCFGLGYSECRAAPMNKSGTMNQMTIRRKWIGPVIGGFLGTKSKP
jgi:hypothetical protein